jgi:hypothetical protein
MTQTTSGIISRVTGLCVMAGALLNVASVTAQRIPRTTWPVTMVVWHDDAVPGPGTTQYLAHSSYDTLPARATYWREGARIGAISLAAAGLILGAEFCDNKCGLRAVVVAVGAAPFGYGLGALVGGQFKKR